MATTADALAANAAGAGAASAGTGAASSGNASSGAGGGAADAGGAVLTDEAILGMTEGQGDTSQGNEGNAGAAAGAATAAGGQQQTAAQQAQGTGAPAELTIDTFKPLFGREIPITDEKGNVIGKVPGSQIQALWDKWTNANGIVSALGSPAEAREAATMLQSIGGVKELAALAEKASGADQTDATFWGGSPEERRAMVNEWYDGEGAHEFAITSQAIAENVAAALEVMEQRDPQRYAATFDRMTRQALDGIHHGDFLAALAAARQSGEGLEEAVDALVRHAERFGLAKPARTGQQSAEERRIAEQRQQLTREQKQFADRQTMETVVAADQQIGTTLDGEIDRALGELKINGRAVFGENSKNIRATLAGQIRAAVDDALAKNSVFVAQANGYKARGIAGREKELVELTLRHARLLLPRAVEQVMAPWTNAVVSQANGAAERARAGASRTEAGGGTASRGGTRQQPFTSDELKKRGGYGSLSDDDILNA